MRSPDIARCEQECVNPAASERLRPLRAAASEGSAPVIERRLTPRATLFYASAVQDRDDVLVGRSGSIDLLRTAIAGAAGGRAALVLIEGEAGIGKTRMADAAASVAREAAFDVALGRSFELERHRPFGPVIDALALGPRSADPRRAAIAVLLQEQGSAEAAAGPGHQFRAVTAVVDLVEELTVDRPLLLVLEDLHWADPSSLLVIRALSARLPTLRLVILVTLRPVPRSRELEAFLAEFAQQAIHERLVPLDQTSVAELVGGLLGRHPSPELMRVIEKAGGNPLFVRELVHGLIEQHGVDLAGCDAVLGEEDASVASTVMNTILDRLRMVRTEVMETLRLASVLGTTFSMSDLSVVAGRSALDLLEPLEEARRAGVLGEDGTRLRFRHDLVRDALYESMTIAARCALHRQAGESLAAAGAPVAQVAEHMTLGATWGDASAAAWLARAGREALSASPASAVELLERALALGPPTELHQQVSADLVLANLWCGRSAEAAALAERLLASAPSSPVHDRVRLSLIHALWVQGHWQRALAVALTRCEEPAIGDEERGRLLAETVMARLYLEGPGAASAQASEALALGQASGDDVTVCVAGSGLAVCAYFEGRFFDAVSFAEQATAAAERSATDEPRRRHPYFLLGLGYVGTDRLDDAGATHRHGRAVGERLGTVWDGAWYQAAAAGRAWFSGDWDDAVAEAEAALAMADETGTYLGRAYAASILGLIALHRGEPAAGRRHWSYAREALDVSGPQIGGDWTPWLGGLVAEAEGRPDEALAGLLAASERFERGGMVTSLLRIAPDAIRLAIGRDRHDQADRIARGCERLSAITQPASVRGTILRCRGLASGDVATLLRAVEAYRESPRKLERAAALEDGGRALCNEGRGSEAAPLLEEALAAYENAAASVDEARSRALLRAVGVRKGRRGPRGRPATGWDSLTGTELRVVRLVANGDSNPAIAAKLYISRHTVETHLRHILTKLGASSRVEVAAEAARRGYTSMT